MNDKKIVNNSSKGFANKTGLCNMTGLYSVCVNKEKKKRRGYNEFTG